MKRSCDPFYKHGLILISTSISNHMPNKVWDEIAYHFPNFNGTTVAQFRSTLHDGYNYLSMLGLKLLHVSKRDPWIIWDIYGEGACRFHELCYLGYYLNGPSVFIFAILTLYKKFSENLYHLVPGPTDCLGPTWSVWAPYLVECCCLLLGYTSPHLW